MSKKNLPMMPRPTGVECPRCGHREFEEYVTTFISPAHSSSGWRALAHDCIEELHHRILALEDRNGGFEE